VAPRQGHHRVVLVVDPVAGAGEQLDRLPARVSDIEALSAEHGRDWALVVAGYPWLITGWPGRVISQG
jgi:hypothetical protein